MNAKDLGKELLGSQDYQEIETALELLENEEYEKIYDYYGDVINELILVNSNDEFLDFINSEVLNESIFIFGLLIKKNECVQIGGYEEQVQKKINLFISEKLDNIDLVDDIITNINIFTDYDGEDNFQEYVKEINQKLNTIDMEIVVLFNDIYSACCYSLLLLNKELASELLSKWDDNSICIQE